MGPVQSGHWSLVLISVISPTNSSLFLHNLVVSNDEIYYWPATHYVFLQHVVCVPVTV